MLTAVDLDDKALLEADEIENVVSEWDLTTKFEGSETPVAKESPHRGFRIGRLTTHLLCKTAELTGNRPMIR